VKKKYYIKNPITRLTIYRNNIRLVNHTYLYYVCVC